MRAGIDAPVTRWVAGTLKTRSDTCFRPSSRGRTTMLGEAPTTFDSASAPMVSPRFALRCTVLTFCPVFAAVSDVNDKLSLTSSVPLPCARLAARALFAAAAVSSGAAQPSWWKVARRCQPALTFGRTSVKGNRNPVLKSQAATPKLEDLRHQNSIPSRWRQMAALSGSSHLKFQACVHFWTFSGNAMR